MVTDMSKFTGKLDTPKPRSAATLSTVGSYPTDSTNSGVSQEKDYHRSVTPFSESTPTNPNQTFKAPNPNIDQLEVEQRGARLFLQSLSEDLIQAFLQNPVASLRSWGQAPAPALNSIDLNQTNISKANIFTSVNSIERA